LTVTAATPIDLAENLETSRREAACKASTLQHYPEKLSQMAQDDLLAPPRPGEAQTRWRSAAELTPTKTESA